MKHDDDFYENAASLLVAGSQWKSRHGKVFTVVAISNATLPKRYAKLCPISVVYMDQEGQVFSIRADVFMQNYDYVQVDEVFGSFVDQVFAYNAGDLSADDLASNRYAEDFLHFVIQQVHQVLVVAGIYLGQHGVRTSGEVAFHYFGNLFQLCHYRLVHGAFFQLDTHIRAGSVSEGFRVDVITRTYNDTEINQTLHTLVDGSTRYAAFGSYILERNTGVLGNDFQNLPVKIVYFFHNSKLVKFLFLSNSKQI